MERWIDYISIPGKRQALRRALFYPSGDREGTEIDEKNLEVSVNKALDKEEIVWYNPRKSITEQVIGKKRTFASLAS